MRGVHYLECGKGPTPNSLFQNILRVSPMFPRFYGRKKRQTYVTIMYSIFYKIVTLKKSADARTRGFDPARTR